MKPIRALILANNDRYEKYPPHSESWKEAEVVYCPIHEGEEGFCKAFPEAEVLIADAITPVTPAMMDSHPNLKIIHSEGVGYEAIDLAAAAQRGIYVCNCPGINDGAVAEHAICLMLGLLRDVYAGHNAVLEGRQMETKLRKMFEGIKELSECTVGLIGFGAIARATALRLAPFGCKVYYTNRTRKTPEEEARYGVEYLPMEELLAKCDMVSLHVAVTPDTQQMVNEAFLNRMRPDAFLINTGRGQLVDNEALCRALENGTIAGAGLDTISPEPVPADHPLCRLSPEAAKKVLYSPHLGGITEGTFRRAHDMLWRQIESVFRGERPEHIVNGI